MTLVTPDQISPDDEITDSSVNTPVNQLAAVINGGIDDTNISGISGTKLAAGTVATAKIADDAVTPDKWTNPYCFRAYGSGSTTLTDATFVKVAFATESFDHNNNFASSTYTAPVSGVYAFSATVYHATVSASPIEAITAIYKNGVIYSSGATGTAGTVAVSGFSVADTIPLTAGDTVEIYHYQNSAGNEATNTSSDKTYFSGHLVHAT